MTNEFIFCSLGLLIGFIMCSVLQSSSASIGVLQALAMTSASLMPMKFAIYLIIGINVGSAMPLFLSAIGAKTNTVSNYENNISGPDEDTIVAIAKVLQCDINYLFSDFLSSETEYSISEQAMIEKYRKLDAHGRRMVDYVVNEEFVRCDQPPNTE